MKKLKNVFISLLATGFLFCNNNISNAGDKIRLSAGYSSLSLENKFDSDANGSYDGGVFNRISFGGYIAKNGELRGIKTKGLQYDLVFAFGESKFTNKNEEEIVKRSFYGVWPAVSYMLDDGENPNFRFGIGGIPFAQIENYYPGESHHANYFGLEGIFGLDFNDKSWPIDVGFVFTYGYIKMMGQSENEVENVHRLPDNLGFFSIGFSVADRNVF